VSNNSVLRIECAFRVGKQGWTFADIIADLELLLFVGRLLSLNDDMPLLCRSIVDRDIPVNEGYELLLKSIAGLI
jgi:nuclear protein localization protein 4 homolog